MSLTALREIIDRVGTDEAFRELALTDPDRALTGFDLTDDERSALLSGDSDRLTALGVDVRESKGPAF